MSFPRYERYKDSRVEWLGDVPEHWTVCALNYRYEVALGKMLDEKRITGNHLAPYLRNVDVQWGKINTTDLPQMDFSGADLERYSLRSGDLVVCEGGEVGRAAVWNAELTECFYQKAIHRLRPRTERDVIHFFFHVLRCAVALGAFSSNKAKATIAHLPAETFRRHFFPFPPICEQRSIFAFLDYETAKIDALIEQQRRLIDLLTEKRQAVISRTITQGLNPKASLKLSGADWIGAVPSHWTVERAGHLFTERDERSESGDEEMLTVSHLTGVTPRSEKTVNMFEAETTEGYKRVYSGDLVINTLWAWMGAMGVSSYAGIVSPAYHVYRARPTMFPGYVNALVRMSAFAKEASRWSKGVWSSRLRLYPQDMFQIAFPVPPLDEQQKISERILKQDEEMAALIRESELGITLLLERRDALISAAVTGKIDVRNYAPKEAA